MERTLNLIKKIIIEKNNDYDVILGEFIKLENEFVKVNNFLEKVKTINELNGLYFYNRKEYVIFFFKLRKINSDVHEFTFEGTEYSIDIKTREIFATENILLSLAQLMNYSIISEEIYKEVETQYRKATENFIRDFKKILNQFSIEED